MRGCDCVNTYMYGDLSRQSAMEHRRRVRESFGSVSN